MDLGLSGRKAIVCASSQGLGYACAAALLREGCEVVVNGRDEARLTAAADRLAADFGRRPAIAVADINTDAGRQALLAACAEPDILVNNNAGPPPGRMKDWDHAAWIGALEANMIAPILLMQATVPGMRARKFGRVVNITSAMVKSPRLPMGLSTTARTGLTAFAKALSREAVSDNVTINNLLPEKFETARLKGMTESLARVKKVSFEEARDQMLESVAAGRFGQPEEFGDACAFLCSAQAGYISGQNLQLDGGSYDGLL
jgi:3-oxoacyl-[acyl-carrier protein] reductase